MAARAARRQRQRRGTRREDGPQAPPRHGQEARPPGRRARRRLIRDEVGRGFIEDAMIDLYTAATPNGFKASIALEELGLPYAVQVVDLRGGAQFRPEFLRISPNNKIPAIVDRAADDLAVFESGAILIYLAEKTGRLLAASGPARYAALEWLFFQVGHVGPTLGQLHHFANYAVEKLPYAIERFTQRGAARLRRRRPATVRGALPRRRASTRSRTSRTCPGSSATRATGSTSRISPTWPAGWGSSRPVPPSSAASRSLREATRPWTTRRARSSSERPSTSGAEVPRALGRSNLEHRREAHGADVSARVRDGSAAERVLRVREVRHVGRAAELQALHHAEQAALRGRERPDDASADEPAPERRQLAIARSSTGPWARAGGRRPCSRRSRTRAPLWS